MTEQIGLWRATYSPGEWIVLGGPTSLVVLQPAPAQSSPLVEVLWEVVLHASSLDDLVAELAKHNVSKMPDFAAFFWHGGEMRSLIRGELRIVDLDSGDVVAAGADVQTWNEVGLGLVRRVRVDLGAEQHTQGELLRLPLVVGAVAASALELDATGAALVSSPQPTAFPAAKPADAAAREAAVLPMPAQEPVAELESARSAVVDAVVVEDSAMLEPGAAEEPARLDRGLDDQPPAVARRRAEPVEEGPDTDAGPEPDAAASDTEESGTEEPGTEEPGTEEPSTEEPGTEEKPEADEKVGERWDPFGRTEAYQAFPEDADDSASADAFSPADESGPESDEPRRGAAADPFAPQVSRDPHNPFELSIVQDREDDVAVPPPGHNPFAVPSAGASPFAPPGSAQSPAPQPAPLSQPSAPPAPQVAPPAPQLAPPPVPPEPQAAPPAPPSPHAVPGPAVPEPVEAPSGPGAVLGVICERGHENPPEAQRCRRCGGELRGQPQLMPRPTMAVLRVTDGQVIDVDRSILIGRSPQASKVSRDELPTLVSVVSPSTDISRTHLQVSPDGWEVVATDLHSTNGTLLIRPGQPEPEPLPAGEPVRVFPGCVLDLGDGVSIQVDHPA